jgi:hypothetical protein
MTGDITLLMTKGIGWRAEPDMTVDVSTPLVSALTYVNMRLSVFPLAVRDKKPPKLFKWDSFQHTLPTEEQVNSLFRASDANIAIATGAVSCLIGFDIDGDRGKSHADDVIQNKIRRDTREAMADTLWVETGGGGLHIWIRYNPDEFAEGESAAREIKSAVLWRGTDGHSEIRLKGNGGYVVAPPSVHPTGSKYRFIKGNMIAKLSKNQILDLIRCFRQIDGVRRSNVQREQEKKEDIVPLPALTELDDERVMDIVVILRPYYLKGRRHDFVLFLSGWLRKEGIAIESARKIVEGLAEGDEELHDRLATLQDTYSKESLDEVKGYQGLLEILQTQLGSADTADQILKEAKSVFPENRLDDNSDDNSASSAMQGDRDGDENDEDDRNTKAKKALQHTQSHSKELFLNEFGRAFAAMYVDDHTEIHPMDERRFRNWISSVYYREEDDLLAEEDIKKVVRILEAQAEFDSDVPRHRLDVRVRGCNKEKEHKFETNRDYYDGYEQGDEDEDVEDFDEIYYDLTNRKWEAVRITAEGWKIVKNPPILFRRYGGERAQPHPDRNYDKDVLNQFISLLNVRSDDHKLLLKGLLPSLLWPNTTPKPVLMEPAAHGSGKTTMFELIKDSIDPNTTKTASIPKELFNLKQYLAHNYMSFFDNVSYLSDEQSDTLCRAVTGSGDMKRKLYENDEDIIYNYRRIIGLNGINNAATRPDLLDRGIIIELEKIERKDRKLLRAIKREYNKLKPKLLAFYLDIIVKVLKERQQWRGIDEDFFGLKQLIMDNGGLPRLADWVILAEQIAAKVAQKQGETYEKGEFLRAFDRNLKVLNVEAIKESLVAEALITFMTDMEIFKKGVNRDKYGDAYSHWEGSSTLLLADLNRFIDTHPTVKISTKSKTWPQSSAVLGKEIRRLSLNLAALGIIIQSKRTESNVIYQITKMATLPTVSTSGVKTRSDDGQNPVDSDVGKPTAVPTGDNGQDCAQNNVGCRDVGTVETITNSEDNKDKNGNNDGNGGASGSSGDIFRLPLDGGGNSTTTVPLLDGKDYVAFDLEWINEGDSDTVNRTIHTAAFVDNRGNQKVLHISDFGDFEPALLQAITDEILKYPASMGWYTAGISKGTRNHLGGGVSTA